MTYFLGIKIKQTGNFNKTYNFLNAIKNKNYDTIFKAYAEIGVQKLIEATPIKSGATSDSWGYVIEKKQKTTKIIWTNDNIQNGCNVAILIQYGHGTKNGAYVQGKDYINPAIKEVLNDICELICDEIKKS